MLPPDQSISVRPLTAAENVTLPAQRAAVLHARDEVPEPATQAGLPSAAVTSKDRIQSWSSGRLAVVTTPAEIGSKNAQELWAVLAGACLSHDVTIADMAGTVVCGDDVITVLLMALRCTEASGGELWLAVGPAVGRLLRSTPISGAFPTFDRLRDALASLHARRPDLG